MRVIGKEFLKSLGLSVIIFGIWLLVLGISGQWFRWDHIMLVRFLFVALYTSSIYMANVALFLFMDRFFDNNRVSAKRVAAGFVSSFVVSLGIIFLLRILEDVIIQGETFPEFLAEEKLSDYYMAMAITLAVTFAIYAFYFYKKYQENRVKQQKIIAGTASAKFESLKNQIDPHFLFNSLNVLSSLIEENPDGAQRFTTSLSKIYRYVLEQKDKELVSVQEELDFARTYMNLLKMRFENSVFYELPESPLDPEAKVVPLSLQLLLENTVKHNIVSEQKPLYIKIFGRDDYLVVQNNYQKKETLQDRKGVGLQNIINRYGIITARKVHVEQTENYFTVKLPILTKQVVIMETHFDTQENSYYKAQKKVEEIKGFYGNLTSYILINAGLMILNLATSPEYLWFLYPAVSWGIGLAIHGMVVFNYIPFFGKDWEEKKIREILEKEKSDKWQ